MEIPDIMTASVLLEPRRIELQQRPVPAPGPREVLIRVDAIGVCGSDTHFYESGAVGDIVVSSPVVLGHETSGTIVATGSEVDDSRVGELVSVEPQHPCRRCELCKDGKYHLCREMQFYGAWPVDGSFSEYVVIEEDFAFPVPESMTAEEAALVEPVSVALHACRRAGVFPGSKVLITGAGPIGILTAQVARSFGATQIVVSDPVAHRREFALAHGATEVRDPMSEGLDGFDQHFDVYIDASGNGRAILSAIPAIARGGVACLVGMGGDTLDIPIAMLQHREITLTGTFRYVNTWPTAIELIATGKVDAASVVTGHYGLDDVEGALMKAKTDPLAIKTVILPGIKGAH